MGSDGAPGCAWAESWAEFCERLRSCAERLVAIPLRMLVSRQLKRSAMLRRGMEHRFFSVLAEATRELRRGWELARESIDSAAAAEAPSPATLRGSVAALARQAEQALAEWRRWPGALRPPLARAVLSGLLWGRAPRAIRQLGRRRAEHERLTSRSL